jgi:predicted metal-dependent hydrolase
VSSHLSLYCAESKVRNSTKKFLVDEITTLRHHLEATHAVSDHELWSHISLTGFKGKYRNWAKSSNFELKLPGDVKQQKEAAEKVTRTLDRDLVKKKLTDRVVPYSNKLFRQAAIEWLIATDQVCQYPVHSHFLLTSR